MTNLQMLRLARATAVLRTFPLSSAPIPKFPGTAVLSCETAQAMAQAALTAAYPTSTGDRTYEDYAIEHAEDLAVAAKDLLAMSDRLALVRELHEMAEEGDGDDADEIQAAEEEYGEARQRVRDCIHEFRKRADRAGAKVAAW